MRRSIAFALVLCGCARVSLTPTVPPVRAQAWILGAGDMVQIDAWNDPAIAGTYVLDETGAIAIGSCGRVVLGGLAETEITTVVRRCLVDAEAYEDPIYVNARVVHRDAHITVRRGEAATACDVPWQDGLTLVSALALALGPAQGRVPDRVTLRRAGVDRTFDLGAILAGDQRDEALAPDDEILLPARRAATCLARARRLPGASPPDPEFASAIASSCGALILAEAELLAQGKRAAHPEVIATARARESRCAEEPNLDSLRNACAAARQRHVELSINYGPAHPTMVGLAAALAVCDAKLAAPA